MCSDDLQLGNQDKPLGLLSGSAMVKVSCVHFVNKYIIHLFLHGLITNYEQKNIYACVHNETRKDTIDRN